eukprot:8514875-Pyramimonas_sp.AAC.1
MLGGPPSACSAAGAISHEAQAAGNRPPICAADGGGWRRGPRGTADHGAQQRPWLGVWASWEGWQRPPSSFPGASPPSPSG